MKSVLFSFWVIVNLLLIIACLSLWISLPEFLTLNWSLTAFTICLAIILTLTKRNEVLNFLKSKFFARLIFHLINVFLVLCILGLINFLSYKNYKEFDLTQEKRNSLTQQTIKILEMVKMPLKLTLFSKREEWGPILNLLKLYQSKHSLIQLDAFDTDLRPDLVKQYNVTQNGTVRIEYGRKSSQFVIIDELSVTNAFLKILNTQERTIFITSGHGELSCDDKTPEGISFICQKLKEQDYKIETIDLTQVHSIPSQTAAVLILGPTSEFLQSELTILEKFLEKNGSLFLALAPAFQQKTYSKLVDLIKPFGLNLGNDVVIDRLSTVQGAEATIPIISKYNTQHVVTQDFRSRTIFPLSSSVQLVTGKSDTAELLAFTSDFPGSWAETDLKKITEGKAEFNETKDFKGPVGLLGVAEGVGSSLSRVGLLGSSSFLINAYQQQSSNTSLFLNTISWILNDEAIISLNRPGIEEMPVILSAQHLQIIFLVAILIIPLVFFGGAILVYRRRRVL